MIFEMNPLCVIIRNRLRRLPPPTSLSHCCTHLLACSSTAPTTTRPTSDPSTDKLGVPLPFATLQPPASTPAMLCLAFACLLLALFLGARICAVAPDVLPSIAGPVSASICSWPPSASTVAACSCHLGRQQSTLPACILSASRSPLHPGCLVPRLRFAAPGPGTTVLLPLLPLRPALHPLLLSLPQALLVLLIAPHSRLSSPAILLSQWCCVPTMVSAVLPRC